jgi:hypothetical protein
MLPIVGHGSTPWDVHCWNSGNAIAALTTDHRLPNPERQDCSRRLSLFFLIVRRMRPVASLSIVLDENQPEAPYLIYQRASVFSRMSDIFREGL